MASTKATKPTKTTRAAAIKRATSMSDSKPEAPRKIVRPRIATRRKMPEEMTLEELTLFVWDKAYKSRHRRLDQ